MICTVKLLLRLGIFIDQDCWWWAIFNFVSRLRSSWWLWDLHIMSESREAQKCPLLPDEVVVGSL